jgi:hypothetical protein
LRRGHSVDQTEGGGRDRHLEQQLLRVPQAATAPAGRADLLVNQPGLLAEQRLRQAQVRGVSPECGSSATAMKYRSSHVSMPSGRALIWIDTRKVSITAHAVSALRRGQN